MTKSSMDRKYDSLMKEAKVAGGIRRAIKNLQSNEPEAQRAGRHDLTAIVNAYTGQTVIKDEFPDAVAIKYGLEAAVNIADFKATEVLRSDHEGLVKEFRDREDDRAKAKYKEAVKEGRAVDKKGNALTEDDFHRMGRGYLGITPFETGDAFFDQVGELHAQYKELSDAVEALGGKKDTTLTRTDLVSTVAQYVGRDVEARLKNIDVRDLFDEEQKAGRDDREDYDDAVNSLMSRAMQNIIEGSPEMAVKTGDKIARGLKKQIETMLTKERRADYVEANLRARASHAEGLFRDNRKHEADGVYAGVVRDMYEIVK